MEEKDEQLKARILKEMGDNRKLFLEKLEEAILDNMFGDGQEIEYVRGGIEFKGLDKMTDQELIEAAIENGWGFDYDQE